MTANRNDIPLGRQNAISRKALAKMWKCSERDVRRFVANLRRVPGGDGCAILSTSSTSPVGYWRSDNPAEIQAFILETENRARHTFLSLRDARRVLNSIKQESGERE